MYLKFGHTRRRAPTCINDIMQNVEPCILETVGGREKHEDGTDRATRNNEARGRREVTFIIMAVIRRIILAVSVNLL